MAYVDDLIARRDAVAAALLAIGTKPNYSIDGQSVDHVGNRESLREELKELNEMIQEAGGPYIVETEYS